MKCTFLNILPFAVSSASKTWTRLNVGLVLSSRLFGSCDKKLAKRVQEVNKKLFAATLAGNVVWVPGKFLEEWLPRDVAPTWNNQVGEKLLAARTQKLPLLLSNLTAAAASWCARAGAVLGGFETRISDIDGKRAVLQEALVLARQCGELAGFVANVHAFLGRPMTRGAVRALCRLVEVQKSLEVVFRGMGPTVVLAQGQVAQQLAYEMLVVLEAARKALIKQDKAYSRRRLDALSLVGLGMRLLDGPGSKERRLLARCAIACAAQLVPDVLREEEMVKLKRCFERYDVVVDLAEHVDEACDYSALLHHRGMMPAYFASLVGANGNLGHVTFFLSAYGSAVVEREEHCGPGRGDDLKGMLGKQILEPVCREIETSLRLHVHSHLKLDEVNPFKAGVKDGNRVVRCGGLPVGGEVVCPKRFVEHYLDDMFYNLTTVALHDWKTYR